MKPAIIEMILEKIKAHKFTVLKMKKVWMRPDDVAEFYKEHSEKPFFKSLVAYFTSGPCLALTLSKEDAVREWRDLIGPANPQHAKESAPTSLRAMFGTDNRINAVFGSDSQESANREIQLFFDAASTMMEIPLAEEELSTKTSPGVQKTLCLIKSEDEELRQSVIERIICRGIEIFKRDEIKLDHQQVLELFPELIEGPVEVVDFLTKTTLLALVLKGENVIAQWREIAGPEDPIVAVATAPQSIRAMFGKDVVHNGVHASVNIDRAFHEVMQIFPHALERGGSVVLRDSRVGTSANPYPKNHHLSKEELHAKLERTVALIKPDAYGSGKKDAILERVLAEGFVVVKGVEMQLSLFQAQEFYKEHQTKPFYDSLISYMSGSTIYAMVLEKENAVGAWRELAGPTNSVIAKEIAPTSLRALFGTDGTMNAVHGSDAPATAERELKVLFGDEISAYPDPLPGTIAKIETMRSSVVEKTLEEIAASRSSLKGGERGLVGSKSNLGSKGNLLSSRGNLASSKGNLSPSKSNLSPSKSNLSTSKSNLVGTKAASVSLKSLAPKAVSSSRLSESKDKLSSKSKLPE